MRVAVFADIHGNLPALEAVVEDLRAASPDALVCLGDVALSGPSPRETVELLSALGCPVVRGNADRQALEPPPFRNRGFPHERELYEIDLWGAAQLDGAARAAVEGYVSVLELPGLLCFHGSPERDDEVLEAATSGERLEELRATSGTLALWAGGHTHQPLLRTLDGWQLLNPGSVGLPFETRGGRMVNVARAEYALLDGGPGGWQVQFRRLPYEVKTVQDAIRTSVMPHADWLAGEWAGDS